MQDQRQDGVALAVKKSTSCSAGLAIAGCVLALWPTASFADNDAPVTGTVLLDVRPQAGVPAWISEAVELNVHSEIASYQRITVLENKPATEHACGTDRRCHLRAYGRAGIDIVLFATVARDTLHYELYETWTPARVSQGSFAIGAGASLIGLKQETLRAFHPLLTQGGLLDQKPYLTQQGRPGVLDGGAGAATTLSFRQRTRLSGLFLAIALLFALPFVVAAFGLRRRRLQRLAGVRTSLGAVLIVLATGTLAVLVWLERSSAAPLVPPLVRAALANYDWAFGVLGGMAGGWCLLDNLRIAFPPFAGFDRISHGDVSRLLFSGSVAAVERVLLLAAYYTPFVLLMLWTKRAFSLPHYFSFIVLAPTVGLGARFWFACWVDGLALYLDDHVVDGSAGRDNPWHREIQQYFIGYLRRTGWDIEPRLLGRVIFLPGRLDGVYSYGGGRTHCRIVVGTSLLELAMGALADEQPAEPKAAVALPDFGAGVRLPHPVFRAPGRSAEGRIGVLRRLFGAPPDVGTQATLYARKKRPSPRKSLGQAATLLGHVAPVQGDELVPLIADNVGDLEVVRELLSEHYAWYAPDPDEEHDDSDPNDKDFLFGALAREIGAIERRDCQLSTLLLAGHQRALVGGGAFRRLYTWMSSLVRRLFLRHPSIIADGYAALNFARHHLMQHLSYLRTRDAQLFTTRADQTRLHQVSLRLLASARAADSQPGPPQPYRASFRDRQLWLSPFFAEPTEGQRTKLWRRLTVTALVIAALVSLAFAAKRSIAYHPIYVERIAQQQRVLAEETSHDAQDKGQPADGEKRP